MPEERQYFLGVGGEQKGPFSAADVLAQAQRGEIQPDALVWFEGLPAWQPIQAIEPFAKALSGNPAPAPEAAAPVASPLAEKVEKLPMAPLQAVLQPAPAPEPLAKKAAPKIQLQETPESTGANYVGKEMEPVFSEEDSSFSKASPLARLNKKVALGVLGGVVGLLLIWGVSGLFSGGDPNGQPLSPTAQLKKKLEDRNNRLRTASSELLLKPQVSARELEAIIKEDSKDAPGQEAVATLVDFYRQKQSPSDAARVLMTVGRPAEAAKLFLAEPPSFPEAEKAFFAAYEKAEKSAKKDFLLQDIQILLGPLSNNTLAKERVLLLEKDFPEYKHPFGYYLAPPARRIADLFGRISFYFVQKLLLYLEGEFPQLRLAGRPLIEVRKDKQGNYRIVGKYSGDILLNQDRMKGVQLGLWLVNEQWHLVSTNLTPERAAWAKEEHERVREVPLSEGQMLAYLENVFKTVFPQRLLHEVVSPPTPPPARQTSSSRRPRKRKK